MVSGLSPLTVRAYQYRPKGFGDGRIILEFAAEAINSGMRWIP
jgi:hypothetical protein